MSTFITIVALLAVGYFIYTRVQKSRALRDAKDLGAGKREKGPGSRVDP